MIVITCFGMLQYIGTAHQYSNLDSYGAGMYLPGIIATVIAVILSLIFIKGIHKYVSIPLDQRDSHSKKALVDNWRWAYFIHISVGIGYTISSIVGNSDASEKRKSDTIVQLTNNSNNTAH